MDDKKRFHNFANEEKQQNYLIPEELPEGAYGAPVGKDTPVENKSTPWKEGQRYYSAFNYENKALHQNMPRQIDGSHPVHDDPNTAEQAPYTSTDSKSE